jgi:hypothetical protein
MLIGDNLICFIINIKFTKLRLIDFGNSTIDKKDTESNLMMTRIVLALLYRYLKLVKQNTTYVDDKIKDFIRLICGTYGIYSDSDSESMIKNSQIQDMPQTTFARLTVILSECLNLNHCKFVVTPSKNSNIFEQHVKKIIMTNKNDIYQIRLDKKIKSEYVNQIRQKDFQYPSYLDNKSYETDLSKECPINEIIDKYEQFQNIAFDSNIKVPELQDNIRLNSSNEVHIEDLNKYLSSYII